jgi:hypothetical protein
VVAWADTIANHQSDGILNRPENSQGSLPSSEIEAACVNEGTTSNSRGLLPVDYGLNDNIKQILEGIRLC